MYCNVTEFDPHTYITNPFQITLEIKIKTAIFNN